MSSDRGPAPPLRVMIVDDDQVVREGLAFLIDSTAGYRCVGTFASVEHALASAYDAPDVVLLDIRLPGLSGVDGVPLLRGRFGGADIVMLSVFGDRDKVFASICRGASGYLLKTTPPARLLEAIREVREGGAPMSPEIARSVIHLFRSVAPPEHTGPALTPQEVRLLTLLARGDSYRTAGQSLHITENTVRNYIRSIYEKLHVHSKTEAVTRALKRGLIQ